MADEIMEYTAAPVGDADTPTRPGPLPGRTTVAERVVARVAQHAAAQVSTVILGGLTETGLPRVDVELAGQRARMRIHVASTWPEPTADVAMRVRDAVSGALERNVGVHVDDLVVTVTAVRPPMPADRRVR